MSWYEKSSEYEEKGIDYDLGVCLEYNPQETFTIDDIVKVLAVWEGENDGDDWRWVLELSEKRYVFLQGGCDYTGWDCQSWAVSVFADTPEQAAEYAKGNIELTDSSPADAGLGHMLNIFSGEYTANFEAVRDSLLKQLKEGKEQTWTESMSYEFNISEETMVETAKKILKDLKEGKATIQMVTDKDGLVYTTIIPIKNEDK